MDKDLIVQFGFRCCPPSYRVSISRSEFGMTVLDVEGDEFETVELARPGVERVDI